jgi:hypothetical protein
LTQKEKRVAKDPRPPKKKPKKTKQTRGLSQCGLAIYIKKYLKAKERRIMETQIFISPCKNYITFK